MSQSGWSLRDGFLRSSQQFPHRPALELKDQTLDYAELRQRAAALAATLDQHAPAGEPALTAVFAYRSATAFTGVLAALFRGHGYVPLNRTFPIPRTQSMLQRSGCRALIVDSDSEAQLEEVLAAIETPLLIILPERDDVTELAAKLPTHKLLGGGELAAAAAWQPQPVDDNGIAYLLFTSGSTGIPKGVAVAHRNVTAFVAWAVNRYQVNETDRLSQTFAMSFDLSAFDMFVAWERGACLCCPPARSLIKPDRFIKSSALTIWFSVPSTAAMMSRFGALKPDTYPSLRWSLFCGEALPADIAEAWARAAPNSVVENLYGPTELTISCTAYRWDPATSPADCELDLVPIGAPFPGMDAIVVDADLNEVEPGAQGELLMTGPQLTLGYWQDEDKTAAAFVVPPGRERVFYRTGDLVRRPLAGKPMTYIGRTDHQVQVRGHRVELGEVEAMLRRVTGADTAIALAWPVTATGADGIVAFVSGEDADYPAIHGQLKASLPSYMIPSQIHATPVFPLNSSGKVDRGALRARLEDSK